MADELPVVDFLTIERLTEIGHVEDVSFGPLMRFALMRAGVKPKKIKKRMKPKLIRTHTTHEIEFSCAPADKWQAYALLNSGPFRFSWTKNGIPFTATLRAFRYDTCGDKVRVYARSA